LAIGSIAGSLALTGVSGRSSAIGAAVVVALLAGSPWWPRRTRTALRTALVGLLAISLRLALLPSDATAVTAPQGHGPWTMIVESIGSPRDGRQVATLRLADRTSGDLRLAATLPAYPTVEPGAVVVAAGRPRPRPDSPYGQYLARVGAWGTLEADRLTVEPGPADLGRGLERLRRSAGDALAKVLPEPEAGLAAGILVGLRDRVDRDVAAAFTTAGVSHVVAISGWNIAIVAAAIASMAGRMHRRRRAIVTAVAIAAYIAFAGASPSVLRAGAMAGVVLIARESGRASRAAAALGWAAAVLLIADPRLIGDAGFQLSSLATAGLIAWATPVTAWIDRVTRGRLPGWLSENLGVSLAAQAATLPVILASFGRLALVAPAVNLVVVPIVAPAMAAGIVALMGGLLVGVGLPTWLGAILAAPGWVAFRLMIAIVDVGAAVPFASVTLEPAIGTALGIVLTAGAAVAFIVRRRLATDGAVQVAPRAQSTSAVATHGHARNPPGRPPQPARHALLARLSIAALVTTVVVTGAVAITRPPGVARVVILDVGQGDAILVEGARGGRLLVDGGPDPGRLLVALDRRVPPWDRRIDVLILSHPHEDHVAGLAQLLERYRVGRVFEPGMIGPGPGYAAWADRLGRPGAPGDGSLAAGDRLAVDEIDLRVLWPVRGRVPRTPPDGGTGINNVSIVLLGQVDRRRFLLAGDVEQDIDPALLASGLPHLDLLKVAHHGSKTATTQAFVDAVRPRIAVASAGAGNPYGHPARSTLDRLAAAGSRVLRTDRDGSVTIAFEASGTTIHTEPRPRADVRASVAAWPAGPVAFVCSIPAAPARPTSGLKARPAPAASSARPSLSRAGSPTTVGYHRPDDGPRAGGSRCPALLPGSPTLVRGARPRGRRGRGLARPAHRGARRGRGPVARRGCGAPPRRRQDPARRRSRARPPPRRGIGRVVDPPRLRRAGAGGRRPPGDPPGRRRCLPPVGRVRDS
jgi:competence protein ComEC